MGLLGSAGLLRCRATSLGRRTTGRATAAAHGDAGLRENAVYEAVRASDLLRHRPDALPPLVSLDQRGGKVLAARSGDPGALRQSFAHGGPPEVVARRYRARGFTRVR